MNATDVSKIKNAIRRRDKFRCVDCGLTQRALRERAKLVRHRAQRRLHVHRIQADGPYSFENCKTVCPSCHCKYRRDYTGEMPPKPTRFIKRYYLCTVLDDLGMTDAELAATFGEEAKSRLVKIYDGLRFYPNAQEAEIIMAMYNRNHAKQPA